MAFSPHRNNTHQQPPRQQQKCGHGPWMVRTEPWVGMKPWIGEDGTLDRDETLGCGDGVGGKMVQCVSHLWRLVSVIGIHCYYCRMSQSATHTGACWTYFP